MKTLVLGHRGMVGGAILRALDRDQKPMHKHSADFDLSCYGETKDYLSRVERGDIVILCAARVGGIGANMARPAEFIRDNLLIAANVIHACHEASAKLVYLGSSCIYPRDAKQPITEDVLMTGPLEPTNAPYATAKIAGIQMLDAYRRQYGMQSLILMPCNLYGPGDNFDLETGHVLPSLIRRFVEAKESGADHVTLWGTGNARREFMHVDDLANAALHLVDKGSTGMVNVGTGEDWPISDLADIIAVETEYEGCIEYDSERPDGTPRKLLDVSKLMASGWFGARPLSQGIRETVEWYKANR
jgi:GDP-L-fucose synthase